MGGDAVIAPAASGDAGDHVAAGAQPLAALAENAGTAIAGFGRIVAVPLSGGTAEPFVPRGAGGVARGPRRARSGRRASVVPRPPGRSAVAALGRPGGPRRRGVGRVEAVGACVEA